MIYELGDRKPVFKGDYYVAPNAAVIGSVVMEHGSSVWWNVTIRGDNDVITLGENVNVQDGSVIHTDEGVPVVAASQREHRPHGDAARLHHPRELAHRHRRDHPQRRGDREELPHRRGRAGARGQE